MGQQFASVATPYTGPVQGLTSAYINVTSDSLNIAAASPGWFIKGGPGTNSISASSGTNVLDGGSASNFMIGGTGTDTFYADVRDAPANFWDIINNFHAGDAATVWGMTQAGFNLGWKNNQGAPGHLGLTLHAASVGGTNVALTLVGSARLTCCPVASSSASAAPRRADQATCRSPPAHDLGLAPIESISAALNRNPRFARIGAPLMLQNKSAIQQEMVCKGYASHVEIADVMQEAFCSLFASRRRTRAAPDAG